MSLKLSLASIIIYVVNFAAGLPVSAPIEDRSTQCLKSKVLILGAGMAGVSAGETLTKRGIDDFKIIEYQDRIGGRTLHTDFGLKPDGTPYTIELGTNWITGLHTARDSSHAEGIVNPIWILAEEVNLTTVPTSGGSRYYDWNGANDWSKVLTEFGIAYTRVEEDAHHRIEHGKPDVSMRVGFSLAGWDPLNDPYKQAAEWLGWDNVAAAPADISSMIFGVIGADASEGELLGEYDRFVMDQRGYDILANHLARKYLAPDDKRLVLKSPIKHVEYAEDAVTVHTVNNTCYTADYAVCTFSLGVLQQSINGQAPVVFSPAFPKWKSEAVFANVMATYQKIFYQFNPENVFWPKHIRYLGYASPTDRGYWPFWESLDYPGSPLEGSGIIFSVVTLGQAERIEAQTDEVTMQEGLAVLQQMFPDITVPQPINFTYPRWATTPWSFGSYSNWAAGYTMEQQVNFRANLDRLWFAGEATSNEFFGYLHGAFYEGGIVGEEIAACVNGLSSCADRTRYTDLSGWPESYYNKSAGFQFSIEETIEEGERLMDRRLDQSARLSGSVRWLMAMISK